jgi:hypothetical protein
VTDFNTLVRSITGGLSLKQGLELARRDANPGSLVDEPVRNAKTDPSTCTGDDRRFAFQASGQCRGCPHRESFQGWSVKIDLDITVSLSKYVGVLLIAKGGISMTRQYWPLLARRPFRGIDRDVGSASAPSIFRHNLINRTLPGGPGL